MEKSEQKSCIGVSWTAPRYPSFPYSNEDSSVYKALKNLWKTLGRDEDNPFGQDIRPGEILLLKPNWVRDFNPNGSNLDSLITHVSLLKHLIDFAAVAMEKRGTVVIADAPLQNCDFNQLMKRSGVQEMVDMMRKVYPDIHFILEDWRLTVMQRKNFLTSWSPSSQHSRDDFGKNISDSHYIIDLQKESFLEDIADYADRFRVTCYKWSLMKKHHAPGKHEYLVTNRIQNADFMINVAKMKTHIKAGLTGSLKSLVGINGHKEYLPHHIKGPWLKGGDNYLLSNIFREKYEDLYDYFWETFAEMPMLKRKVFNVILQILRKLSLATSQEWISAGSWRGNETIWRTTLDLNHALYFHNAKRPRAILNIIDGIIAGEGEGPLSPDPKPLGVLIGCRNPAYADAVMGHIMGYNLSRVPTVYHAIYHRRSKFAENFLEDIFVHVIEEGKEMQTLPFEDLPKYSFVKPRYWKSAQTG